MTVDRRKQMLYVAPTGDDRWSGARSRPTADGRDGPLATVAEAQRRLRTRRRSGAGAFEVRLRGGVYELPETWTLGPEDSGTAKAPVIYAAYRGERPVLSGGRRIRNWTVGEINGRPCWVADLPDVRAGRWRFTQLFVDGKRLRRTRWPRTGFNRFAGFDGEPDGGFAWHQGPRRAEYAEGDFDPAWRNRDDIELVALQLWFDMHFRITSVDPARRVVEFHERAIGNLRDETGKHARYWVENIVEQVLEPGDWYVDNAAGRLYYIPFAGQTPEGTEIVAPRLGTLLAVRGEPDGRKAAHIRFENLDFRHAEYALPGNKVGCVQAASDVPGAIVLEDAEACVLYGCTVSAIAQYGIEIRCGGINNRVVACEIHDTGAGGVKIGHETQDVHECEGARPSRRPPPPSHAWVTDCSIHDCGILFPGAIGIWIGLSGRNRVLHNHIFNIPYTAISCGWSWDYRETPAFDNRIEYNHIHHINHQRLLSDNGGIYTLGLQPGTRQIGNVLHDIDCYGYGGWGLYPDEGSSEMLYENNLVYRTRAGGFAVHYGRDYLCRNNIFALAESQVVNLGKAESHRCGVFEHNLVYWRSGDVLSTHDEWDRNHYRCRDNLFYSTDGLPPRFNGIPAAELLARGQHEGLVHADPLFAAPDAGDFTLRSDSPALGIGFEPFDPKRAGPRYAARRPTSFSAWRYDRRERPEPVVGARLACRPSHDVTLRRDGSFQLRATLRIRNLGTRRAIGSFTFEPFGAGGRVAMEGLRLAIDLPPGRRLTHRLTITAAAGTRSVRIECHPSGSIRRPAGLLVNLRQVLPLDLPGVSDWDALETATEARALFNGDRVGGQVWLAMAPGGLAVRALIQDTAVQTNPAAPWAGSGLEVFVAPERPDLEDRAINHTLLSQVYVLPESGGHAAIVARQETLHVARKPDVPVRSHLTAQGYEVCAILPLELLKLPPEATAFRLEIVAHAGRGLSGRPEGCKLFGAGYPAAYALDYGHVRKS